MCLLVYLSLISTAIKFHFPIQDEVDQIATVEELEKQIEKLSKVSFCRINWKSGNNMTETQTFFHIIQINRISSVSSK